MTPSIDRAGFDRALAAYDFERPQPFEDLARWTIAQMQHGVVHMTHPRYFGLFNPCPTFPAQAADRIAAAFNPQLASAVTSPAAVAIETHVISAIARRAGLPAETTGHFTSGGSEANCTALICALTQANRQYSEYGARAFAGPPTFYVSRESHLAWLKIAHEVGIGRAGARMVPTDGSGRMDAAALARMIEADRAAGSVPVMIAATAGTTGAGMIDPLAACARVADEEGLWYHVDAAWAGALIVSERLRGALAGIEHAESVTIDAHKWLATTMGCGMFFTRHPIVLSDAFHVTANFMPPNAVSLDPYVVSMQWSRRFLGLRLFMGLATAGWAGYAEHVERSVALAALIAEGLVARGWRVVNRSPAAVLCLEPPADLGTPRTIVTRVVAAGRAWVSVATFEGREVIRACVTHGETTEADVAALIETLNATGPDEADEAVAERNAKGRASSLNANATPARRKEKCMSTRSTIYSQIEAIAAEGAVKPLPPLTDDLVLLDSGLDSLAIAILVARLEEKLGFDPFTESDEVYFPVTLGDFIRFYEKSAQ